MGFFKQEAADVRSITKIDIFKRGLAFSLDARGDREVLVSVDRVDKIITEVGTKVEMSLRAAKSIITVTPDVGFSELAIIQTQSEEGKTATIRGTAGGLI